MAILDIQVRARVARPVGNPFIVCGNKDYTIRFDFDPEWEQFEAKTARFAFNGQYVDVPFSGSECPVPMLYKTSLVKVGVYVDGMSTTSPAVVRCVRSILCGTEEEAGAAVVDTPLTITENGVYDTPNNVRYNPITVKAKAQDEPLTIAENNTEIVVPDGVRYTPITVAIPENYQEKSVLPTKEEQVIVADEGYNALSKVLVEPIPDEYVIDGPDLHPTLNAPTISLNAAKAAMNVTDYRNGNFTDFYRLYLNGEDTGKTFTEKSIVMTEYGITETDEIAVQATAGLFNNSPLSNMTKWSDLAEGTIGLTYSSNVWTGGVVVDATDIYVAGMVNGRAITSIKGTSDAPLSIPDNATIYLPDSITDTYRYNYCLDNLPNYTNIVFGTDMTTLSSFAIGYKGDKGGILDFRKATKIPTFQNWWADRVSNSGTTYIAIVIPDEFFDEWIVASNFVVKARYAIRASDYEAQQGGSV